MGWRAGGRPAAGARCGRGRTWARTPKRSLRGEERARWERAPSGRAAGSGHHFTLPRRCPFPRRPPLRRSPPASAPASRPVGPSIPFTLSHPSFPRSLPACRSPFPPPPLAEASPPPPPLPQEPRPALPLPPAPAGRDMTGAGDGGGSRTGRRLFPTPSPGLAPPPSRRAFLHRPRCGGPAAGPARSPPGLSAAAAPPSAACRPPAGCEPGTRAARRPPLRPSRAGSRCPGAGGSAGVPPPAPPVPSPHHRAAPEAPYGDVEAGAGGLPAAGPRGEPAEPRRPNPLSPLTSAILGRSGWGAALRRVPGWGR